MYLKGRPITMHMPKDQVDSYSLEARAELPGKKLKLDWVYPLPRPHKAALRLKAKGSTLEGRHTRSQQLLLCRFSFIWIWLWVSLYFRPRFIGR